ADAQVRGHVAFEARHLSGLLFLLFRLGRRRRLPGRLFLACLPGCRLCGRLLGPLRRPSSLFGFGSLLVGLGFLGHGFLGCSFLGYGLLGFCLLGFGLFGLGLRGLGLGGIGLLGLDGLLGFDSLHGRRDLPGLDGALGWLGLGAFLFLAGPGVLAWLGSGHVFRTCLLRRFF